MKTHVIFFTGPIGAGKTTLGSAVAARIGAAFLDGDDFADQHKPWYASSLTTSRRIAEAALLALTTHPAVVVAYPLRCVNYLYFRRRMGDAGHDMTVLSLVASFEAITDIARQRIFSDEEKDRIAEMISEGYSARPFSDLVVETDVASFADTVDILLRRLGPWLTQSKKAQDP